ncbi:major facilitator superfamily domain-containing protein [Hyaloscypha finlandica]|nr:major facilitator superfamily domain-containing protein [Hyaloscypha finlandica]
MAMNWTSRKKWTMPFLLSTLTLLNPMASSMFAPSVEAVLAEFHTSSADLGTFIVSSFLLAYVSGPLFIAPMSELYERLPVYHIFTLGFILFNVACANSTNFLMIIVFRIMSGVCGCTPLTLGPGSIADMFRQEIRGEILSVWVLPIMFGPTVGPTVGRYLPEARGWRWDFWFLVILTNPMTILEKRVKHLHKSTGSPNLEPAMKSSETPKQLFVSITRPTKILLFSPVVLVFSIIAAIAYGTVYLLFTTMTQVFEDQYGINKSNIGLTYLAMGIGQTIGTITFGLVSDRILARLAEGGEMKPEYRLPPFVVGLCLESTGLVWYGSVTFAMGIVTSFMTITTYMVDAFTPCAASATAANTVFRSIGGALLPLAGPKMYAVIGLEWGNTVLAFIALPSVPIAWFVLKRGEKTRQKYSTS